MQILRVPSSYKHQNQTAAVIALKDVLSAIGTCWEAQLSPGPAQYGLQHRGELCVLQAPLPALLSALQMVI